LAPLLELDHVRIRSMPLVENCFTNLYRVFSDQRVLQIINEGSDKKLTDTGFWDFFKRRFSLKTSLTARIKLCSFVCKREAICSTGEELLDRRLKKVVQMFTKQNFSSNNFNLSQFKEPLEIVESLLV
jgi:hypothetical protein